MKDTKLFITDSYYNVFSVLTDLLKGKVNGLTGKNLIFCEEKVSLMTERVICSKLKGSFNTDVYSFGKFLRTKKTFENVLSKEGSAMAVKRIITFSELKKFPKGNVNLAPSIYELISQLKSAKVTPEDVLNASDSTRGLLSAKLHDIGVIYGEYEKFLSDKGFLDQSSIISYLPSVIEEDESIKSADVYLIGYTGWTKQMRSIIESLLKNAKSVTAILTGGDNEGLFLNETVDSFRDICRELKVDLKEEFIKSKYNPQAEIIKSCLFNPTKKPKGEKSAKNIYLTKNSSIKEELSVVAEKIKSLVIEGKAKYSDIAVTVFNTEEYERDIRDVFNLLDIPYFFDSKKKATLHPLVRLISDYVDCFNKNLERDSVISFLKNPLFSSNKELNDKFVKYVKKYNVNYGRIKESFKFEKTDEDYPALEEFRINLCKNFEKFDIFSLLKDLNVEEKISSFSTLLEGLSEKEESAVNSQIFDFVVGILEQMKMMFGGISLSHKETKEIFLSGISALEISVIPQYQDAVFIGDGRETALALSNYLFAVGLNDSVPTGKMDSSILTDNEIDSLKEFKLLIEPKINVLNARMRENAGLSVCAFDKELFISYSFLSPDGKNINSSEIFDTVNGIFETSSLSKVDGYYTEKEGLKTFSSECNDFSERRLDDFSRATSFYNIVNNETVKSLLNRANKEVYVRLNDKGGEEDDSVKLKGCPVIKKFVSPTTIEDFYKCPYYSFLNRFLNLQTEDKGESAYNILGAIFHEIFNLFVNGIIDNKIKNDGDVKPFFEEIKDEVLSKESVQRLLIESDQKETMQRVISEAEKFCKKFYNQINNSEFKPIVTEASFGENEKSKFPAVSLNGGRVKLTGVIDRVDSYKGYYNVIDYKTGKVDSSDKELFIGEKLQLYLYALAINQKNIAGLYYLPIKDSYLAFDKDQNCMMSGKTLLDEDLISACDKSFSGKKKSDILPVKVVTNKNGEEKMVGVLDSEAIKNRINYAFILSENAAKEMCDGVIVQSPIGETCSYCPYKGMCEGGRYGKREVKTVGDDFIDSIFKKDGEENGKA